LFSVREKFELEEDSRAAFCLEKDGTDIEEDAVLVQFQEEVICACFQDEIWCPSKTHAETTSDNVQESKYGCGAKFV
jgi:hypothetical protein